MKRLSFLIVLLISLAPSLSAQFDSHRADSIANLIPLLEGKEKLEAYNRLSLLMRLSPDSATRRGVLEDYLHQAQEQKDLSQQSTAHTLIADFYFFYKDEQRFMEQYPAFLAFARKNNFTADYFELCTHRASLLLSAGRIEEALGELTGMYEESKTQNFPLATAMLAQQLAEAFQLMRRYDDAEPLLRESLAIYRSLPTLYHHIFDAYANLCITLKALGRYPEALDVLSLWEDDQKKANTGAGTSELWGRFNLDITYADLYTAQGMLEEADAYFEQIEHYAGELPLTEKEEYLYRRMIFLEGKEQWGEALAVADTLFRLNIRFGWQDGPRGLSVMNHQAWLLGYIGRGVEAVDLYELHNQKLDSLRMVDINARIDELRTVYQVDQHLAGKKRNRAYFLFATAVAALLLLILSGWIHYSRRLARKNRILFRQIKQQDRIEKELKQIRSHRTPSSLPSLISLPSLPSFPEELYDEERWRDLTPAQSELFTRFHHYLLTDRNFTRLETDNASYLTPLATNRTTLAEATRIVAGVTPPEYIKTLRLNQAKSLLEEHPEMTVETIAEQCGFKTVRTLYRLFRERYAMTPSQYRQMLFQKMGERGDGGKKIEVRSKKVEGAKR